MMWTWWQRGELAAPDSAYDKLMAQISVRYHSAPASRALAHAEAGDTEEALNHLRSLSAIDWHTIADDQSEGVSMAMAAAACGVIGAAAGPYAARMYEVMRPYAGTVIVVRAPAAACMGPADHYLGLLAGTLGDLALAEVHHEAALRLARRMESPPFVVAAEVELARTLRRRRRNGDEERVVMLLRHAEESALRLGLHRLAQLAAEPG
jgi:hypothetical protein